MDAGKAGGFLQRLVRQPLVHFILIGAALFAANWLVNGSGAPPAGVIVISGGRIAQLEEGFRSISGRAPGQGELKALVDDFVMEEISYREAVAMGLDADDTVVRRRMRQKLDFLLEDMTAIAEPTEAELRAWLKKSASAYSTPPTRALRQALASRDRRGEGARRDAEALLQQLRDGADPATLGDPSMLPAAVPLTSEVGMATLFGEDFARTVFSRREGPWFGPVESVFGFHAVEITDVGEPAIPSFETVREQLRNDLIGERRRLQREKDEARMRARYDVRIEWPEGREPAVAAR